RHRATAATLRAVTRVLATNGTAAAVNTPPTGVVARVATSSAGAARKNTSRASTVVAPGPSSAYLPTSQPTAMMAHSAAKAARMSLRAALPVAAGLPLCHGLPAGHARWRPGGLGLAGAEGGNRGGEQSAPPAVPAAGAEVGG